jgi:16S rRNA (guanine966-N2)-methyltransferase
MPGIRVIAGKAKGRKLKMVPGSSTRPIGDRVKQALFNILGVDVVDADFLDLFAGTGSVGIEALSRGAAFCQFIELDRKAIQIIYDNLTHCGFNDQAHVLLRDSFVFLEKDNPRSFDIIFIAPPQYLGMWDKSLRLLDQHDQWLNPDGIVIVQIDPSEYVPQDLHSLSLYDQRKYGNTALFFYEKPGG